MNEAKTLGMAFRMGMLFRYGIRYSSMAMDKKPEKWITIKGNHIPLDKGGSPMSKTGKKILNATKQKNEKKKVIDGLTVVGPDNLPEFKSFCKNLGDDVSYTRRVKEYVKTHLKPVVESIRYPGGMPPNCKKIAMGAKQMGELASHMNDDKAIVLPFVPHVYREGEYRTADDEKHPLVKTVVYTTAVVTVDGVKYFVELVSKEFRDKSRAGEYIQYGISKADKIAEDENNMGIIYELVNVKVKRLE